MSSPLPSAPYTPFYCEENVYQLLSSLKGSPRFSRTYAVFVSNPERHALLFQQRASRHGAEQGHYVLWDYHVIAVAVERERSNALRDSDVVVLDRDSRLGDVVPLKDYLAQTFRPDLVDAGIVDPGMSSRFRVVPAQYLLDNFASDRSHMLLPPDSALDAAPLSTSLPPFPLPQNPKPPRLPPSYLRYIKPPPPYPPIRGPQAAIRGETHNLWTRFLDMRLPRAEPTANEAREYDGFGRVVGGVDEMLVYPW